MMTQNQIARLSALRLYGTKYELILTNGHARYLVAYCRKTGPGLRAALRRQITGQTTRLDFIAELTGTAADAWRMTGPHSAQAGAWVLQFSGRTEREAITMGELPRVSQCLAPVAPMATVPLMLSCPL